MRCFVAAALGAAFVAACGPAGEQGTRAERRSGEPMGLAVDVMGDSGRTERWPRDTTFHAAPESAAAAVWLARVSPARTPDVQAPLPEPEPSAPPLEPSPPPGLAIDPDLKPPILRAPAPLRAPAGVRGVVELDVRVDEEGQVSDALWAGGSVDSALVLAATECALAMRFYPAQRSGAPLAVWCRQRFDFGERSRRRRRRPQATVLGRAQARRVRTVSKPSER